MLLDQLKPTVVVRGPIFPEPVQVIVAIPMGAAVKLVGKGLNTGQVHEPILSAEQLAELTCTAEKEPFDGDPRHFRLGIEAMRLALAYEYDPYFSLSPEVHPIQDPARLGWEPIVKIEHYHIGAEVILEERKMGERNMGEKI